VITSEQVAGFSGFSWLSPIVGPLGTAGLVLAMVIFMLLERRDLRDRVIGLMGDGQHLDRPARTHSLSLGVGAATCAIWHRPSIGIGIDCVTLPDQPASSMVWPGQVHVV
jgi:hypothetical protein